jgi:outer membrane protein TolC
MEANAQERTAGLRQSNEALQIGVAEAAFFPTLTLSAPSGFESSSLSQWLTALSRFWAVGPSISETVFDDGLRRAQTDFARAGYEASVGTYRQTVLTAFQAVEDNLAALHILEQEAQVQDEAVPDAQKSVTLATNGKDGGKTWHPIHKVFARIYQSIGIHQCIIEIPFLTA